mmetsp:Transcript_46424/g.148209  ORF Transcript_46424/g.148209 Transcript_46424/m.148209 type:complete len:627 (+) Transcript_46424:2-1882(+)
MQWLQQPQQQPQQQLQQAQQLQQQQPQQPAARPKPPPPLLPSAEAPQGLPPGWRETLDAGSGQHYYYQVGPDGSHIGQVQWEKPEWPEAPLPQPQPPPPPPQPQAAPQPEPRKEGMTKEQLAELEELRRTAADYEKVVAKLSKKDEQLAKLREEKVAMEAEQMKMLRALHQIKEQLKRVTEIAEKKGCGKLLAEIMDEAEVTQTLNSPEYSCFNRLYDDAVRRQKKLKEIESMRFGGENPGFAGSPAARQGRSPMGYVGGMGGLSAAGRGSPVYGGLGSRPYPGPTSGLTSMPGAGAGTADGAGSRPATGDVVGVDSAAPAGGAAYADGYAAGYAAGLAAGGGGMGMDLRGQALRRPAAQPQLHRETASGEVVQRPSLHRETASGEVVRRPSTVISPFNDVLSSELAQRPSTMPWPPRPPASTPSSPPPLHTMYLTFPGAQSSEGSGVRRRSRSPTETLLHKGSGGPGRVFHRLVHSRSEPGGELPRIAPAQGMPAGLGAGMAVDSAVGVSPSGAFAVDGWGLQPSLASAGRRNSMRGQLLVDRFGGSRTPGPEWGTLEPTRRVLFRAGRLRSEDALGAADRVFAENGFLAGHALTLYKDGPTEFATSPIVTVSSGGSPNVAWDAD